MTEDCPMHQPIDDEELRARVERRVHQIDLLPLLRRAVFGGFDCYHDYVNYGEMFIP